MLPIAKSDSPVSWKRTVPGNSPSCSGNSGGQIESSNTSVSERPSSGIGAYTSRFAPQPSNGGEKRDARGVIPVEVQHQRRRPERAVDRTGATVVAQPGAEVEQERRFTVDV